MTKHEILMAALDYWKQSTFPAWASDSCRVCPTARDGGCRDEHDEKCPYGKAEKRLIEVLEAEGVNICDPQAPVQVEMDIPKCRFCGAQLYVRLCLRCPTEGCEQNRIADEFFERVTREQEQRKPEGA